MKLTKSKNLTGLVLAVLMALPLFSIASRVIYVQANKNAYQSYSGQNLDTYDALNSLNEVELNKNYHFSSVETYDNVSNVHHPNYH